MGILGLRDTSNFVTNQRPENWREGMLLLYPNGKAPLTALTSLMKSKSTDDPVFHWWEKSLDSRRLLLTADIDASQTTFTVTGALGFKAGDMLISEYTKEVIRVSQDPTADTSIVVTRGVGGSTATAITYNGAAVNPYFRGIGSSFEEASDAPSGVNFDPTEVYNYCQIFRSTLEMSRTAQRTRLRTGDAVKEAKRECLEYFGIDMEMAFWFGKRGSGTLNGKPIRYTGGLWHWLVSNAPAANIWANAGANVNMSTLESKLEFVFRLGSSEKIAFCGNVALLAINQIVRKNSQFNIQTGIKEFGMDVSRLITPFGTLVLKTHPLFNQMAGGTNAGSSAYLGFNSSMAILDADELIYRYVDDVKYEKDLQANGLDGMKSGYIAECGMEIHHASTHHWWTGITAGVVDS